MQLILRHGRIIVRRFRLFLLFLRIMLSRERKERKIAAGELGKFVTPSHKLVILFWLLLHDGCIRAVELGNQTSVPLLAMALVVIHNATNEPGIIDQREIK
jgi:hypothetical protein